MGTITYKTCDRCGAQFETNRSSSTYPVQKVAWVVPFGLHLHNVDYKKPNERELCSPCRQLMFELISNFMSGGK